MEPKMALAIKGLGIKCARVSFQGSSYLEIIAPDPEKGGPIGTLLRESGIKQLKPFHWAIRTKRAEALSAEVKRFGYTPDHISMYGTNMRTGAPRKWEMTYLYGHKNGGICPFFINWEGSDHPCETMPIIGDLVSVKISVPKDDSIHQLINHTESEGFSLMEGPSAFQIKFNSPEGEVSFGATKMTGFRFPGFEQVYGDLEKDDEIVDDLDFVFPENARSAYS
eukprot:Sro1135_g245080.2  (223) ;mRNA; r:25747-26415